jgi:hypothetical protein
MDKQLYDIFYIIQYTKYQGKNLLLPSSFYSQNISQFNEGKKLEQSPFSYINIVELLSQITKTNITSASYTQISTIYTQARIIMQNIQSDTTGEKISKYLNPAQLRDLSIILGIKETSLADTFIELINFAERLFTDQELFDHYLYSVNVSKFQSIGFTKSLLDLDKDTLIVEMITPLVIFENFLMFTDKQFRDLTIAEIYKAHDLFSQNGVNLIWELYSIPDEYYEFFQILISILQQNKEFISFFNQKFNINIPTEYEEIKDHIQLIAFFEKYGKFELEHIQVDNSDPLSKYTLPMSMVFFQTMIEFCGALVENNLLFTLIKFANDPEFQAFLDDIFLLSNTIKVLLHYDKSKLSKNNVSSSDRFIKFIEKKINIFTNVCKSLLQLDLMKFKFEDAKKLILKTLIAKNEIFDQVSSDLILEIQYPSILESPFANRSIVMLLLNLALKIEEETNTPVLMDMFSKSMSFKEIVYLIKISLEITQSEYSILF